MENVLHVYRYITTYKYLIKHSHAFANLYINVCIGSAVCLQLSQRFMDQLPNVAEPLVIIDAITQVRCRY